MRAKTSGTCPYCNERYEVGINIIKFDQAIPQYGWYDLGARKGEQRIWYSKYGHIRCVLAQRKDIAREATNADTVHLG